MVEGPEWFSSEPLGNALDSVNAASIRTVYPSPSGSVHQEMAWKLAGEEELIFICGRYEESINGFSTCMWMTKYR
jgi:tRNA (guanine-N1)-methyltransferase